MRRIAFVCLASLTLAACNEGGPVSGSRGGTLALESVDGVSEPGKAVIANAVAAQGSSRSIALVGRGQPSPYRVKAYLSPTGSQVAYVFDVFDNANRRALRVQGEEPGALDEATAGRIAARSLDSMAVLFDPVQMQARNAAYAEVAAAEPAPSMPAMGGPYVPLSAAGR